MLLASIISVIAYALLVLAINFVLEPASFGFVVAGAAFFVGIPLMWASLYRLVLNVQLEAD